MIMGVMSFLLPNGLSQEARSELERCSIAGGPDNMPTPTELTFASGQMRTRRGIDESGWLVAPWRMGGLQISPELQQTIHAATLTFGRAVTSASGGSPTVQETKQAQDALEQGYRAAQQVVDAYVEQVFSIRQQRAPKLDTTLGCRLTPHADGSVPAVLQSGAVPFVQAFNSVSLPFFWCDVELEEGTYNWGAYDALLAWAQAQQLEVSAGPLVDFSSVLLPAWLWLWERDVPSMASFM